MKRNRIQSIRLHYVPDEHPVSIEKRFNEFRLRTMERCLQQYGLTLEQKKEVVEGVLSKLASYGDSGDT